MDEVRVKRRANNGILIMLVLASVGLLFLGWLFNTPPGLLGKADAIGYAVCHRIDARSFHLGDRTLPLCSRCSGTYLGVILALSYFTLFKRRASHFPPRRLMLMLGLFFIVYAMDGLNSYLSLIPKSPHLYEPNNLLRITTAMFFGISLASIVYPGFNQSLWQKPENKPSLQS